jgi:surface protein
MTSVAFGALMVVWELLTAHLCLGSMVPLVLATSLAVTLVRAIPMAKKAKGCDLCALGPRKASEDATPMAKIGVTVLQGTTVFESSKALARFALLMLLPAHVRSQTAITNTNIATAVSDWIGGDTATYGDIGDWDVSRVSNMHGLFNTQPAFNDDISKWNTASVSTMSRVCSVSSHADMRAYCPWRRFGHQALDACGCCMSALGSASMLRRISFGARCFMLRCGSQMFLGASAFNQNIGRWNTARILSMSQVCSLPSHAHGLICALRVPGVDLGARLDSIFTLGSHASLLAAPQLCCTALSAPGPRLGAHRPLRRLHSPCRSLRLPFERASLSAWPAKHGFMYCDAFGGLVRCCRIGVRFSPRLHGFALLLGPICRPLRDMQGRTALLGTQCCRNRLCMAPIADWARVHARAF